MSKKQKQTKVEVKPQVQEEVAVETAPVIKQPKAIRKEPTNKKTNDGWEIKDRVYYIKEPGPRPRSFYFY